MSDTLPILIVDDQPKLLRLIIELMSRLGFPDVEGVSDGTEALSRMRERRYALVISDLAEHQANVSFDELEAYVGQLAEDITVALLSRLKNA